MANKKSSILITGASSGIGKYLAIALSKDYSIILNGRDNDRLDATKLLCSKNNEHFIFRFDLLKSSKIEAELSQFLSMNNLEVTHFIHCAGLMKTVPLKILSLDFISSIFNTNVISAIIISKVLIQRRINNSALKNIVFISSNISNFGAKAFSVYAASKGALDSFMRCLAVELAPNIRVNSILPGAIQTEMTESIFENKEIIERMKQTYPLGLGKPEDIYELTAFLLSDKSRWITGQQFTIDGGRTINISG